MIQALKSLSLLAVSTCLVSAQHKEYIEDNHLEEAMFHRPSTNHRKFGEKPEPSHYKTFQILHKFTDQDQWQQRSDLIIGYDSREFIASAKVDTPSEGAVDIFTDACHSKDKLYQLQARV